MRDRSRFTTHRPTRELLPKEMDDSQNDIEMVSNSQEGVKAQNKNTIDFEHMPGFNEFLSKNQSVANMANLLKGNKQIGKSTTHLRLCRIFFKKAIRKLKGDGLYRIEFPSADWAGNEIAIGIHCDAGGNTDKNGK